MGVDSATETGSLESLDRGQQSVDAFKIALTRVGNTKARFENGMTWNETVMTLENLITEGDVLLEVADVDTFLYGYWDLFDDKETRLGSALKIIIPRNYKDEKGSYIDGSFASMAFKMVESYHENVSDQNRLRGEDLKDIHEVSSRSIRAFSTLKWVLGEKEL